MCQVLPRMGNFIILVSYQVGLPQFLVANRRHEAPRSKKKKTLLLIVLNDTRVLSFRPILQFPQAD